MTRCWHSCAGLASSKSEPKRNAGRKGCRLSARGLVLKRTGVQPQDLRDPYAPFGDVPIERLSRGSPKRSGKQSTEKPPARQMRQHLKNRPGSEMKLPASPNIDQGFFGKGAGELRRNASQVDRLRWKQTHPIRPLCTPERQGMAKTAISIVKNQRLVTDWRSRTPSLPWGRSAIGGWLLCEGH